MKEQTNTFWLRKYYPRNFEDFICNEEAIQSLKNCVKLLPHSNIFLIGTNSKRCLFSAFCNYIGNSDVFEFIPVPEIKDKLFHFLRKKSSKNKVLCIRNINKFPIKYSNILHEICKSKEKCWIIATDNLHDESNELIENFFVKIFIDNKSSEDFQKIGESILKKEKINYNVTDVERIAIKSNNYCEFMFKLQSYFEYNVQEKCTNLLVPHLLFDKSLKNRITHFCNIQPYYSVKDIIDTCYQEFFSKSSDIETTIDIGMLFEKSQHVNVNAKQLISFLAENWKKTQKTQKNLKLD